MRKVAIVFWSGTGNTAAMCRLVAEGISSAGAEVDVFTPTEFSPEMADQYEQLAFGCPSMGDEVLEEEEFAPMFDAVKSKLKGKKIALFGSYGWGDGEWMRIWEKDCADAGCQIILEPVIVSGPPEGDISNACKELGRALASA